MGTAFPHPSFISKPSISLPDEAFNKSNFGNYIIKYNFKVKELVIRGDYTAL